MTDEFCSVDVEHANWLFCGCCLEAKRLKMPRDDDALWSSLLIECFSAIEGEDFDGIGCDDTDDCLKNF